MHDLHCLRKIDTGCGLGVIHRSAAELTSKALRMSAYMLYMRAGTTAIPMFDRSGSVAAPSPDGRL